MPLSARDKDLSQLNGRRFLAQGSGYGLRVWSPGAEPALAVGLTCPGSASSPGVQIARIRRLPIAVMATNFGRTEALLPEGEALMTSAPVRDPVADHLLTPQNTAFLLIDYQPQQLDAVHSMDRALLVKNAVSTVRTIKTYRIPVVHSTVNVANGRNSPRSPNSPAC